MQKQYRKKEIQNQVTKSIQNKQPNSSQTSSLSTQPSTNPTFIQNSGGNQAEEVKMTTIPKQQSKPQKYGIELFNKYMEIKEISICRREDFFKGFPTLLAHLVKYLIKNKQLNDAKGILLRNNICSQDLGEENFAKLDQVNYCLKSDQASTQLDKFGPLQKKQILKDLHQVPIQMSNKIKLEWIDSEKDIEKLKILLNSQFIGLDSEWRASLFPNHITQPAIFQIASAEVVFLIDLIKLKNSQYLNSVLTEVFTSKHPIVIGFDFEGDIEQFDTHLPNFTFIKYIQNFVDAQDYYSLVKKLSYKVGLKKIVEDLFEESTICKVEQMSNWERRPLRQSQQHYAMLDAYILILIVQKLMQQVEANKKFAHLHLHKTVKSLDKRRKNDQVTQLVFEKKVLPVLFIQNKYKSIEDYLQNCLMKICKNDLDAFHNQNQQILFENVRYVFFGNPSQIRCRIQLENISEKIEGIREFQVIKVFIPTKDNDSLKKYEGHGIIQKIWHQKGQGLQVRVDINIENPIEKGKNQGLPQLDRQYSDKLSFYLIYENSHIKKSTNIVNDYLIQRRQLEQHQQFILDGISTATKLKPLANKVPDSLYELGMQEKLNPSQIKAIQSALKERITLIQGPPGTGKTQVLAAIVTNWYKQTYKPEMPTLKQEEIDESQRILVCCPQNQAADLCAELLFNIPSISQHIVRISSSKRENIFNIDDASLLKQYQLLYKMLKMDQKTKDSVSNDMYKKDNPRILKIRFQIEYYFGESNYYKDKFLQSWEDKEGYILIDVLLANFPRMKEQDANIIDVITAANFSQVVEISPELQRIRKRGRKNQTEELELMGWSKEGIANMTIQQYENFKIFLENSKNSVLKYSNQILITTCSYGLNQLIRAFNIQRVIIDEATQATELQSFICLDQAKQIVLIGDDKQLGPVLDYDIKGPTSMFERLILAGYPSHLLNVQYRMHPCILNLPNSLFYENKISSGYVHKDVNFFIDKEKPLLFVNVKGKEQKQGTSFYNQDEVDVVKDLACFLTEELKTPYLKQQFWIISPYQAQQVKLKSELEKIKMNEQVMTIDGAQGRERDFVILSCVRSSDDPESSIGFLKEKKRINVALTRAQHGLIIVANIDTLLKDKNWKALLQKEDVKSQICQGFNEAKQIILQKLEEKNEAQFDPEEDFM